MVDVLVLLWSAATSLFRSRARLEAEILVLRQLINVLRRTSPKRFVFGTFDRLVFVAPRSGHCRCAVHRPARDRGSLAPCWISIVLALEMQKARRESESPAGDP